jgi:putative glycosyltransferase (TIGR04348 family)
VILVASPEPEASDYGNGVTARRWADILRQLGHDVRIAQRYDGGSYTALVAVHAGKSADAVRAFHAGRPDAPIVIGLSGTDLYPDLVTNGIDRSVLDRAARLVVLQPYGVRQVPPELRARTRVITQSVAPIPAGVPRRNVFEVAFLAHVRPVKDPLRLAEAVRLLPPDSRVAVTHVGGARDDTLADEARAASAGNPRYTWLGPLPRPQALAVLARSRLLALTSHHEGGANVISEAIAAGVPVIASAIPGSVGLLGEDYPGYYPAGDTEALARALYAAERNRDGYYDELRRRCRALRVVVDPCRERDAWAGVMAEIGHG